MLKARLDSVRKNKKGFSLVELIIVIAIMVALIAVLAPSFIKYVQKSRDAALATAAEDLSQFIKTEVGSGNVKFTDGSEIKVIVKDGYIDVSDDAKDNFKVVETDAVDYTDWDSFKAEAGIDSGKKMGATEGLYTIKINSGKVTMDFDPDGNVADD